MVPKPTVTLDGWLRLDDAVAIASGAAWPEIGSTAQERCMAAADRLATIVKDQRHVYGITTGFGPLADRVLDPCDAEQLQQNLVHHLASGVGPRFDWQDARAIVLARLNTILQGMSGASAPTIAALLAMLQSDLAPVVPQRGTVGASGDLTPLAHIVLCFQGRGGFFDADGHLVDGPAALEQLGMGPLALTHRDGLALVNGTSAMTGVAIGNAARAARLFDWSLALSAGLAEVMGARAEAWHPFLGTIRPHPGQIATLEALQTRLIGGTRLVAQPLAKRSLTKPEMGRTASVAQDAYTLRCVPQVLGAVADSLKWHRDCVEIELNSVTDNPVFPEHGDVPAIHGGNFMGQHIALASDALANAVSVMAGLAERQVARVCDERLNGGLPAFLHRGPAGLHSGLMGAQVTATALLAELRSIGPASVHSLSTNGANQDVVSMGTIAARSALGKIELTAQILAILAICVAQGHDISRSRGVEGFSPALAALCERVRRSSPALFEDRPLGEEIAALARDMGRQSPPPG